MTDEHDKPTVSPEDLEAGAYFGGPGGASDWIEIGRRRMRHQIERHIEAILRRSGGRYKYAFPLSTEAAFRMLAGGLDLTEYAAMTFRTEVAPAEIAPGWYDTYLADPQAKREAKRDWPAIWRDRLDELIARRHVGPETRLTEQVWQLLNSFAEPPEEPLDDDLLDA